MAKYKIIPSSRTIVQSPISIGHKAEKGVEAIEFDLTAWVETYGSGTLTVIMRRWGDAIPYPIALEIDENNKATWTLSDTDTAKEGMAYAQLSYVVGDEVVKKSDIYTFRVMDSLTGEGEPPEAYESWLEHLTHLAAEAMAEVLDIEGIVTDKTLTVDGGIADAKATGDALALKADKSTTYTKAEVDQMIEDVEVDTDTTLSVSGAPADAKATGDALSALEDAVTEETDKLKADLGELTADVITTGEVPFDTGTTSGGWVIENGIATLIPAESASSYKAFSPVVVETGKGYTVSIYANKVYAPIIVAKYENDAYTVIDSVTVTSSGRIEQTVTIPPGATHLLLTKYGTQYVTISTNVIKTDKTLSKSDMPADAKTIGTRMETLEESAESATQRVAYCEQGKKLYDIVEATGRNLTAGYAVNGSTGTIGSTSSARYFAAISAYIFLSDSELFNIVCDPAYLGNIYYAFFDEFNTLIDAVGTITVGTDKTYIVTVPAGAKYVNLGGRSVNDASLQNAIDSTFFYALGSLFLGNLDTALTSDTLPAQGKAVGNKFATLENLNETTGVRRLRLRVNDNNIPFVVQTGLTNLYLGYGAGGDNTEDTQGDTMSAHDNGKYNVAVGYGAYGNNVDGDHCTAVGFTALAHNTNGDFNTCLGEDALFSNTSGSNNIAVGDHAGQNNQGSNNILIGARVMRPATNASGNIIIGKEAGSVLDTGGNNIIIGNSVNPPADGSNNIIIGTASHNKIIIAGKEITFNQDGTVTWTAVS